MITLTLRVAISCDHDDCTEFRDRVIECPNLADANKGFTQLCVEFSTKADKEGWYAIDADGTTYCPEHAHQHQ